MERNGAPGPYSRDVVAENNTCYFQRSCVGWNMLLCSKGAMLSEQGEICISAVSLKETRPPYFPLPTSAIPGGRWRLSSHGWFTLLISRSHRSWPWGRTAVVTTTSWPTLWVVIRRLPEGGQDLSYSACALTLTCMHSIWVPGFCVLKKNPPYFSPFIIFVVFVHQS